MTNWLSAHPPSLLGVVSVTEHVFLVNFCLSTHCVLYQVFVVPFFFLRINQPRVERSCQDGTAVAHDERGASPRPELAQLIGGGGGRGCVENLAQMTIYRPTMAKFSFKSR